MDDTIWLLENLNHFRYASAFDQPVLGFFRDLHNRYGIVVSCYCFGMFQGQNLTAITGAYRKELEENADWLRFGFHAAEDEVCYNSCTSERAGSDYEGVMDELNRIVGTRTLTHISRIHRYHGSENALAAMDRKGLRGLLCGSGAAENEAYFLNARQQAKLWKKGHIFHRETRLHFWKTDVRVEKDETPQETLLRCLRRQRHVELFTHEWALDAVTYERMRVYCKVAKEYGCRWAFLEDEGK